MQLLGASLLSQRAMAVGELAKRSTLFAPCTQASRCLEATSTPMKTGSAGGDAAAAADADADASGVEGEFEVEIEVILQNPGAGVEL